MDIDLKEIFANNKLDKYVYFEIRNDSFPFLDPNGERFILPVSNLDNPIDAIKSGKDILSQINN
jgi:hypothetical protein